VHGEELGDGTKTFRDDGNPVTDAGNKTLPRGVYGFHNARSRSSVAAALEKSMVPGGSHRHSRARNRGEYRSLQHRGRRSASTPALSGSRAAGEAGEIYIYYRKFIFGTFLSTIVARTSGDPLALAGILRKQVWAVDPNEPVLKVQTMDDVIAGSIWRPRFSAWIFAALGGLALLLTSAGIFGIVAYTTALKSKEVGIRVALGARPGNVVAVVVQDALVPLIGGLTAGFLAALILSRLLVGLLYETSHLDPVSYLGAAALLLALGVAASLRPAWRAATADPLHALRTE
jgi:hypothetical protein